MARIGSRTQTSNGGENDGTLSNIGETVIDPRTLVFASDPNAEGSSEGSGEGSPDTATGKRRGRPPGSKNGTSQGSPQGARKTVPIDVNALQFSLTGIHAILASTFKAPELVIAPTQAEMQAKNIAAVARHYNMQASQQAIDMGNLVISSLIIYGSMTAAIMARLKAEKEAKRQGFNLAPSVPVQAPQATRQTSPLNGSKPSGAAPGTRPKTREDDALLDEIVAPMFN